jgi:hypothetical protein
VAVDASGNIYIADYNNNRVRKIDLSGIITTFAGKGTAGYSGDGGLATAAEFHFPSAVTVDGAGNVYIADMYNACIRKVDSNGIVVTIAGTGTPGYCGDGAAATSAQLANPNSLTIDAGGSLYISDYDNNRIRKINPEGTITTLAGNGTPGYMGDGGAPSACEINLPTGVAVNAAGEVYIGDSGNNRIRKISLITSVAQIKEANQPTVYPVPGNGSLTASLPGTGYTGIAIYDAQGRKVFSQQTDSNNPDQNLNIDIGREPKGIYMMQIYKATGVIMKKVEIVN